MFCIAASLDYVEITNPQVTVKVGEKVEVVCNTVAQYKKFTLQWETIGEFYMWQRNFLLWQSFNIIICY